ncbi:MAG: GNAT family N-acetyltransferase [Taibaiella sp.]|nr:GNAT family N-acetyltransferase [Taibaiella sp.]
MLNCRNATSDDIDLIIELTMKVWPATYTPILGEEQVAYMLGAFYTPQSLAKQMSQGQQFIICTEYNVPVAFASYSTDVQEIYKLNKLYILPDLQGRGIGTYIIMQLAAAVKQSGPRYLQLNVNRYNTGAIAFYEKAGFINTATEDIDIGNGYFMNDYVLQLAL